MSSQISSTFFQFKKVKNFHQDNCKAYLIIRLISLFLTTMALMSFPPSVRALCTFSLAIARLLHCLRCRSLPELP